MATRKKKKQRTMQLMASVALLGTTVAPYVISAEELTITPQNEKLQNIGDTTVQTTPDSANLSLENENTIDNASDITSSGGNTTTELIDNGIVNNSTETKVEAIIPATFVAPAIPTFIETYGITLNFKNSQQTAQSMMDGFIEDHAKLGITADGKKYIQMTIPATNKGWITDFKSTVNGQLQDSIIHENADGTTTITYQIESFDVKASWVKIDIDAINYHHDYTVHLDFPNIENEYTEPTVPTPPSFNAKHVEKNINFQFTAGADFETGSSIDSYLKDFVTQADLVIGEDKKPYAEITFGGHSYAGTALKIDSADGADAEIIASTGSVEGKDLVRTVRVALNADYRADIFFGSSRGNYTFKFDLVEEETKFSFTSGTANDAYFSAWVPRADLVETTTGEKYAYITLAGHSYAVGAITVDNQAAELISSTGSAETKDLVRVVRIKLDATNKAAIKLDGGEKGTYTFAFDFTKQVEIPEPTTPDTSAVNPGDYVTGSDLDEAVFTEQAKKVKFTFKSLREDIPSAAALSVIVPEATVTKKAGKYEVSLQVNPVRTDRLFVTQKGQEIATVQTTNGEKTTVTFIVDNLDHLFFYVDGVSGTATGSIKTLIGAQVTDYEVIDATEQPTLPETVPTFTKTYDITLKFKNDKQNDTSVMDEYVNDKATLGITADGKKYIQMTIPAANKGWITSFKSTVGGQLSDAMKEEKGDGTTVYTFQIDSLISTAASVKVDIDAINYHHHYTVYLDFPNIHNEYIENTITAPTAPSTETNEIVTNPNQFKLNTVTPILFNFGSHNVVSTLSSMMGSPTLKRIGDNVAEITIPISPNSLVKRISFLQNGKEIGRWSPSTVARVASLIPFFAATTNEVLLNTSSLKGITIEVEEANGNVTKLATAIEATKTDLNTTTTVTPGTGSGGGTVITPPVSSDVTSRESISYKMVSDPNGPMADFITGYMAPYFSNAEVVTVDGKNYIEITLSGKAYGFQNLRVTGGYKTISSVGEDMDQIRVIRFPAKKDVTIHVDSGELGYGAYDLLFTFDLSEQQIANAAAQGTGGVTAVQTITPQIVSEGDVKFTIPAESSAIVAYAKKLSAKLVNGKYNVDLTLAVNADLDTFVVKQGDKVVATWDKKNKGITSSNAATQVLSFTVESLEEITFTATTKTRTLTAKVETELPKKEEVPQVSTDGRQSMTYTMVADPNGPMADFITGYLAPYFSNAIYVTENGQEFVELTLTGKAYGFATLQYIDADGKNIDIEALSSTGEGLDQVRVIRLPLIQNKDGVTKIVVDSGDLGYGAYTLFFNFNVPAKSENIATAIQNPFKDIDTVYSKDEILALYKAGITTGTTDTTFSPNANMTRAQFAVMVARALGVTSTKETKFKDVQGKWYAAEVQALADLGIITGVSDTKFKPGDKITRQQAAVMIHRMLKYKGYTNKATANDLNFKDNAKVADYAKEALAELQAQGILTGNDGKVNPQNNLTRAQMAKILKNAADLVGLLD